MGRVTVHNARCLRRGHRCRQHVHTNTGVGIKFLRSSHPPDCEHSRHTTGDEYACHPASNQHSRHPANYQYCGLRRQFQVDHRPAFAHQ